MRAGASLPYGDFDRRSEVGFGGGIELQFLLRSSSGLGVTLSADVLVNGFVVDTAGFGVPLAIDAHGSHRTIPVLVGLRWTHAPTSGLAVFLAGQAGTAMYRPPSFTFAAGSGEEFEAEFDMTSKFVLAFGGGIVVARRFEIGARAYPLGSFPVRFGGGSFEGTDVSMVTVMLGVRL